MKNIILEGDALIKLREVPSESVNCITFYEDFVGVGGFRLALERVGWRHIGSCEIDRFARETYKANFGEYPVYEDATQVNELSVNYDVYCAGFPCQDFSIAGQRKGIQGARGSLVYHVIRRIETDKPKAFLLENVKGLLSADNGRTFKWIIKQLRGLKYRVYWKVLNSKDFGVPQNRERVFIVGFRNDIHTPLIDGVFVYPEGRGCKPLSSILEEDVDKKYHLSEKMVKCLTKHLERHKEKSNGFGMKVLDTGSVSGSVKSNYYKMQGDADYIMLKKHRSAEIRNHGDISPTILSTIGGSNLPIVLKNLPQRIPLRFLTRNQRNIEGDYSFTVDSANTGGIREGNRLRRLTPLECFRLQGFPDEFVEKARSVGISDTQLYKQAGNAITVNVVEALAETIMERLIFKRE